MTSTTGKIGKLFQANSVSNIFWNNEKESFDALPEIYDFAWTLCLKDQYLRKRVEAKGLTFRKGSIHLV